MSEGSVSTTSSRIKQFGLYRTIDARTEEFLRLSRKRQIKQGCACAAVATAITVTIVVGVILIYEYGIVSEFPPNSAIKPNWLGLMNTSEAVPFEAKLDKETINMDPSIRLLPLILKALNKNIYYDKIVEDNTSGQSSPRPIYEKKATSEALLTDNLYSDRNWLQISSPDIYAIEYKTPPVVFYKNPKRNTDYFTKTRRIRDYQRVMNYVNKMINERITSASTAGMLKNKNAFHKNVPISYTTPVTGIKKHGTKKSRNIKNNKEVHCSCSNKMNGLLSRIITILQKLLPNTTQHMLKLPKPCNYSQKLLKNYVTKSEVEEDENNKHKLKSPPSSKITSEVTSEILPTKDKKDRILPQTLSPNVNHNLRAVIQFLMPYRFFDTAKISTKLNKYKSIINTQSTDSRENYNLSSEETTSAVPIVEKTLNYTSKDMTNNKSDPTIGGDLSSDSSRTTIYPYYPTNKKGNNYKYSMKGITSDKINSFPKFDIHALELIKNKLIPKTKITKKYKNLVDYKENRKTNDDNNTEILLNTLRKSGQIIKSDLEEEAKFEKCNKNKYSSLRKVGQVVKPKSKAGTKSKVDNYYGTLRKFGQMTNPDWRGLTKFENDYDVTKDYLVQSILPLEDPDLSYSSTIKYSTLYQGTTRRSRSFKSHHNLPEYDNLDDEKEKIFNEDILTLNNLKNLEKIIDLFNSSISENDNKTNNITQLFRFLDINTESLNSTEEDNVELNVLKSKTSYLEIQRNSWRLDEHQDDYDNKVNNYALG